MRARVRALAQFDSFIRFTDTYKHSYTHAHLHTHSIKKPSSSFMVKASDKEVRLSNANAVKRSKLNDELIQIVECQREKYSTGEKQQQDAHSYV